MLVRYRNNLSLIHPLFAAVFLCLSLSNLLAQQPASPGKLMIADVIVQGNRVVATQAITSQLATKPGKEYQPNVIQDDVRKLMATKQFAHIDPRIESLPDGKVNIFFLVKEFPSVVQNVTYLGAKHLNEEELGQLSLVSKGKPLSPITNKLACQAIVRRYNEQGRPFASCDLLKGGDSADKEVIFNITEGPLVKVRSV
ncbi:MAG: hypothetical protein JHD20_10385, partial [Gemmataceae bacterium]|nr:hypothetical protein [Gemmataceae bacterium]